LHARRNGDGVFRFFYAVDTVFLGRRPLSLEGRVWDNLMFDNKVFKKDREGVQKASKSEKTSDDGLSDLLALLG
jgi:hypothetical protein